MNTLSPAVAAVETLLVNIHYMARNYMTDCQNEEQKRKLRMTLYDQRRISDVYPDVVQIQIAYEVEHRSAFGIIKENHTATYKPDHTNNFTIDCLNRECTSGFFDLKNEVWNMIHSKQTEQSGEMNCKGSEAPDHMYQSCGGSLKYSITIEFSD